MAENRTPLTGDDPTGPSAMYPVLPIRRSSGWPEPVTRVTVQPAALIHNVAEPVAVLVDPYKSVNT